MANTRKVKMKKKRAADKRAKERAREFTARLLGEKPAPKSTVLATYGTDKPDGSWGRLMAGRDRMRRDFQGHPTDIASQLVRSFRSGYNIT